jgi:hypothetical protein
MHQAPSFEGLLVHVIVWSILAAFFALALLVLGKLFAPSLGTLIVGLSA